MTARNPILRPIACFLITALALVAGASHAQFTQITSTTSTTTGRGDARAISADGSTILWSTGTNDFTVSDVDGENQRQLPVNGRGWLTDDGSRIFWINDDGLSVINRDGTGERNILTAAQTVQITEDIATNKMVSIAGDGALIAFLSDGNFTGDNGDGNEEIFTVDSTSGAITQVTSTANGSIATRFGPLLAPDRSKIVFVAENGFEVDANSGGGFEQIYSVGVAGGAVTALTTLINTDNISHISVSGDGDTVAFLSNTNALGSNASRIRQIFTVDSSGANLTQVTDFPIYIGDNVDERSVRPTVTRDADRIYFLGWGFPENNVKTFQPSSGRWNIFAVDIDGGTPANLVPHNLNTADAVIPAANEMGINGGISTIGDDVVLFVSTADLATSGNNNADRNQEVFVSLGSAVVVDEIVTCTTCIGTTKEVGIATATGWPALALLALAVAFHRRRARA